MCVNGGGGGGYMYQRDRREDRQGLMRGCKSSWRLMGEPLDVKNEWVRM